MARIRRILGLARAVIGLLISLASLIKLILSLVGEATNYAARCSKSHRVRRWLMTDIIVHW